MGTLQTLDTLSRHTHTLGLYPTDRQKAFSLKPVCIQVDCSCNLTLNVVSSSSVWTHSLSLLSPLPLPRLSLGQPFVITRHQLVIVCPELLLHLMQPQQRQRRERWTVILQSKVDRSMQLVSESCSSSRSSALFFRVHDALGRMQALQRPKPRGTHFLCFTLTLPVTLRDVRAQVVVCSVCWVVFN